MRRVFSNRFERFTEYRRQEHRGSQRWRYRPGFRYVYRRQVTRHIMHMCPNRYRWWRSTLHERLTGRLA